MIDTPHNQLWEMEYLRDNAKGKARFPSMEMYHKLFWVTEEMNWQVLEVGTGQNGVRYFPMLVNEQVLLKIIYSVYS